MRKLLVSCLIALLGAAPIAEAINPAVIIVNYEQTPNGHINSKYHNGDDGTVATPLIWNDAAIATVTCVAGVASSANIRAALSYPVTGTTTIVLDPPDPALTGVSFDGTNLSCDGTTTLSSGVYVFRARYPGAQDAPSKGTLLTVKAAAGTDTLIPTQPIALTASTAGGTVHLSWYAGSDPYDGTIAGRLDHYEILRNGAHYANLASAPGQSLPWTQTILGSYSPTPTSSQTGASQSFTSAGTGIHNTAAEQVIYRAQQVSGNQAVSHRISGFTSAYQYSTGGIVGFYLNMAQGSPFFVCYDQASPLGPQCKLRQTLGGLSVNANTAGTSRPPHCLLVTNNGTQFSGYYSSDINCSNLTLIATVDVPALTSVKYVVQGLSSQNAGVAESVTLDQVSVTDAAQITYDLNDTGTNNYAVRLWDAAGNVSGTTPIVTVTATVSAVPPVKFHSQQGILSESVMLPGVPGYTNSFITELNGTDFGQWEQLVGLSAIYPADGQFDSGQITTLYNLAKANGIRLVLQIMDRNFSGTKSNAGGRIPQWLIDAGCSYVKQNATGTSGGAMIAWWIPACVDKMIWIYQQLGAWAESRDYAEGVMTSESDLGFTAVPPGIGSANELYNTYMAQVMRFDVAVIGSYPTTNLWQSTNGIPTGPANIPAFLDFLAANRLGVSAPDVRARCSSLRIAPNCFDDVVYAMNGWRWNGTAWVYSASNKVYIGILPRAHDMEQSQMGGKAASVAASELYDYALNKNHDSHLWSDRKTTVDPEGNGSTQLCYKNSVGTCASGLHYTPDWFTFVNGNARVLATGCPSAYTGGCKTN